MDEPGYEQLKLLIQSRMTRAGLDAVRLIIRPPLESLQIGVAAVSGKEIHNQELRLIYCGEQYAVPIHVFAKHDIFLIAQRVIRTHEIAQK